MPTTSEAAAFLLARRNTGRGGFERWANALGVSRNDKAAWQATRARFDALPLLGDPQVQKLTSAALSCAKGIPVQETTRFHATVWRFGATDVHDGQIFDGTIVDFVTHILGARAHEVAPKREGWVVTPTSNLDGHRTNASTTAMHALNLDCDGLGAWDVLLAQLEQHKIAYIAYQSGGWTPTTPKWHILLPLAAPFDTSDPQKISAWKAAYTSARVVFGSLAQLPGEGFDPTVETPSVPIFITERRAASDPPREVFWRCGFSLDLPALIRALPDPAEERLLREREPIEIAPLSDKKFRVLVEALVKAMAPILSGRRDLYLALPGALLDRGVPADDVRAIIEEVSNRCPGDPEYTEGEVRAKHREHLHCAETTIGRHERGETYSRIGTLAERWPQVAFAIDEALPSAVVTLVKERFSCIAAKHKSAPTGAIATDNTNQQQQTFELSGLKTQLRRLRDKKVRMKDVDQNIAGAILSALLKGDDLTPYIECDDGSGNKERKLILNSYGKEIDSDEALAMAVRMASYKLPIGVPFEAFVELFRLSIFKMSNGDPNTAELFTRKAEQVFFRTVKKRIDSYDQKRAAELAYAEKLLRQAAIDD